MSVFTAYHVGRRGEVAGGMTQVVNAYLRWRFDHAQVEVVVSRDGSRGIRAALVALRGAIELIRLPRRNSVVVVHLSNDGSFVREGALLVLASLRRLPTVAHLHGSRFTSYAARRPRTVRRVLRRADRVITLSEETTRAVVPMVGEERVRLVPNAVPAPDSTPAKETVVLFGGSVSLRKGVDVLLDAWELSAAAEEGWRLVVAGPVVDREVVRDGVDAVTWLGAVPHAELMDQLERSSIAVLPSRDEAMPMFLLEGMARANAVVSTPVGGIPAVLGDGAGHLVPVGDARGLAQLLKLLITDSGALETSRRRARAAYDRSFSAASVYPRIEAVWREALDHRRDANAVGRTRRSDG